MTEQEALVALNAVPGLGSGKIRLLAEFFGSAFKAAMAKEEAILASGAVTPAVAQNIVHFSKDKFLSDEYNLVHQRGVRVLTAADAEFPQSLHTIPGAPVVLYILGNADILYGASVAMVGSRSCSYYGRSMAGRFAGAFARAGLTVISGLARGIDTAAHKGCLKENGCTIAVLGSGLNCPYPKENVPLLGEILKKGAVIAEMPMNTPAIPMNFPRRNRIISGLSCAVVVVEAGLKSGALITSDFALEQGRDVFAVPANIDYPTAEGSNRLIKDGARIALSPGDVLEEIKAQVELEFPDVMPEDAAPKAVLSDDEWRVYKHLTTEPMYIDDLCVRAKQAPAQAAGIMLNLALKGVALELPGKYYVKV